MGSLPLQREYVTNTRMFRLKPTKRPRKHVFDVRMLNAEIVVGAEVEAPAAVIAGGAGVVTETLSIVVEVLVAAGVAHALHHPVVEMSGIGTSTEVLRVVMSMSRETGGPHSVTRDDGGHTAGLLRPTLPLDRVLQLQVRLAVVDRATDLLALLDGAVLHHACHLLTATLVRDLGPPHCARTTTARAGGRPPKNGIRLPLRLSGGSTLHREAGLRCEDGGIPDHLPLPAPAATPGLRLVLEDVARSEDLVVTVEVEAAALLVEVHEDHVPLESAN